MSPIEYFLVVAKKWLTKTYSLISIKNLRKLETFINYRWDGQGTVLPDFQFLKIEKDSVFEIQEVQRPICTGLIRMMKQTDDTLIIEFIPESGSHIPALSCWKSTTIADDTLILDESIGCSDSYQYKFIRN